MLPIFKKLLSRSRSLGAAFGDVVFVTPREHGLHANHSFLEWRVKRSLNENDLYVAIAMRPDTYAGAEGSPTNYINFDLEAAVRLRDNLDECIAFARSHQPAGSAALN